MPTRQLYDIYRLYLLKYSRGSLNNRNVFMRIHHTAGDCEP
jgi:hypothetical protein